MENHIKLDDLGEKPLFSETSILCNPQKFTVTCIWDSKAHPGEKPQRIRWPPDQDPPHRVVLQCLQVPVVPAAPPLSPPHVVVNVAAYPASDGDGRRPPGRGQSRRRLPVAAREEIWAFHHQLRWRRSNHSFSEGFHVILMAHKWFSTRQISEVSTVYWNTGKNTVHIYNIHCAATV